MQVSHGPYSCHPQVEKTVQTFPMPKQLIFREGRKGRTSFSPGRLVGFPLIFTKISSVVSLALWFLSLEDSEEHHQKSNIRLRFYGMTPFIFSIWFPFRPQNWFFCARKWQPGKILVGYDSSWRCRLTRLISASRYSFVLGPEKRPDPHTCFLTFPAGLRYSRLNVSVASIARSGTMAIFRKMGGEGENKGDVPLLPTRTFPKAFSALCKIIYLSSESGRSCILMKPRD